MTYRKKLIEVALPLDAINKASAREKSIRHGHPSTLHLWWARRPLAAARAVLWSSLVDDPSAYPERFPTEEAQETERQRLFRILEELVIWENSNNRAVLDAARAEIVASTDGEMPNILDPFCGAGTIPLEAQRLGLRAFGGDLNPVAVLISKAMLEIPPRFGGSGPVHPDNVENLQVETWERGQGLADDIRYYGRLMGERAAGRLGYLYPRANLPSDVGGGEANVVAWIWARTVRSPDPSWSGHVPLVRSWVLRKASKRKPTVWIEPILDQENQTISYEIRDDGVAPSGTVNRHGGTCLATGSAFGFEYIREESRAGRLGESLIAVVANGPHGRIYLPPEPVPQAPDPRAAPPGKIFDWPGRTNVVRYGIDEWSALFTRRQLVAMDTYSILLTEIRDEIVADALGAGFDDDGVRLHDGGSGATAYADALVTYLAFAIDRLANRNTQFTVWNTAREGIEQTFARQAIPMTWDYPEANPIGDSTGSWSGSLEWIPKVVEGLPATLEGVIEQRDAAARIQEIDNPVIATDPPYYDNISYADLSDFFYVWMRRNLSEVWPDEFSTLLTPKSEELIANRYRAGSVEAAKKHFEQGIQQVFSEASARQNPEFPATIFYAFKQEESDSGGTASTGWETFLQGLLDSDLVITSTWPLRTERATGLKAKMASLASSIVIAVRIRDSLAPMATRGEFLSALRSELPAAIRLLQQESIAPVDMAQSAIGPGMAVFSRYSRVIEADGSTMRVRQALVLVNEVLEEVLSEEETEFDGDTRWALTWFEQFGMNPGAFGDAETLSKAKGTSVAGVVHAGIGIQSDGEVRLLDRLELDHEWDPTIDSRLTVWEVAQQLIARLDDSETEAADLLRRVGPGMGERARLLAYLLFQVADRKGWSSEAVAYNSLVQAWSELSRLAARSSGPDQQAFGE